MEIKYQFRVRFTSPSKPMGLNKILYVPNVIKNLISVCKFTTDNSLIVSFDPFGFDIKDLKTWKQLGQHNIHGPHYFFNNKVTATASTFITSSIAYVWHDRLGHPGTHILDNLVSLKSFSCNKLKNIFFCNASHLAKHKCLTFDNSTSNTLYPVDLVYCDLQTSPITSKNGSKY